MNNEINLSNKNIEDITFNQIKGLNQEVIKIKAIRRIKQYSGVIDSNELFNELGIDKVF